jgi:hypothetical protein
VTVSAFGQACLDQIGATVSAKECEVLAKAWQRAAEAIRGHEYGEITVIDGDGDEILAIGLDYKNIPFDEKNGLPPLEKFEA